MKITINDENGNWCSFYPTKDTNFTEILECIEQQIFRKDKK